MTKHSENTKPSNSTKPVLTTALLSRYLPYGLKIYEQRYGLTYDIVGILESEIYCKDKNNEIFSFVPHPEKDKPILRPLSDLTKDEKTCDEINEFLEPNGLEINNFLLLKNSLSAVAISWEEMQNVLNILYREHYDVFGLINKKLAVSIHDVDSYC